jgi:hypothetical protein
MAVDTVKVCAPDGAARQVEVGGRRYRSTDGVYNMAPADARLLRAAGGFTPNLGGAAPRGAGFRCASCGFGSWFTTCGRCGGACTKSTED